ncbi:hypothetical protein [Sulfitobacter mediterraneus]|uniref:hypothetical protein n=1 Tax=Sulfitobacter mediterraneus TaxID=83219 RepID=UPI0021A5FB85|nr:hypothetical protein [Sulfitobacter mediterraneus]UWR10628.1 hypothetical protein K3753_15445 [Sulfitobacter mediterraneus]
MIEFDSARLGGGREPFDIDAFGQHNNTEEESPSDRFAWQLTGVAVSKIADPAIRRRVIHLVAPKVASGITVTERSGDETLRSAHEAWMRFATLDLEPKQMVQVLTNRRRVEKSVIDPVTVLKLRTGLPEELEDLDFHGTNQGQAQKLSQPGEIGVENNSFVASSELISAWLDGLNAVRAEGGHDALLPVCAETKDNYAAELARQLRKVISNFAKRKAYEGGAYRITFAGKFLPSIEGLIEDHLMLPARNAVVFLDIFKNELYLQSAKRAAFSGRWGELRVDDAGELVLKLQKRRSRKLSAVLRGR